jgi:putative ABC transport system substrate-binding protein
MLLNGSKQIAAAALATRLPTVFGYTAHVAAGGLLSYGVDLRWCFYRIAYFVNRILHGTAPGDLPVEFPTKMLLSVNPSGLDQVAVTNRDFMSTRLSHKEPDDLAPRF